MSYRDLRDWLEIVERRGELKRVSGAHWDLEMSSIAELACREGPDPKPVLLFDDIPDYPPGHRTLFGMLDSPWRVAMTLGLPEDQTRLLSLADNLRQRNKTHQPVPPRVVASGPVQANSMEGDRVDLFKFPVPRFHELDGGRYIGTCHGVVQKDPDTGWVNVGAYRIMVVDRNHVTLHMGATKHGSMIMQKYLARGSVMPVAIAIGLDPALWVASRIRVPWGLSEYDYTGGIKGEPLEVIKGQHTGLPLPARAEIIIEGECHAGEFADEGPFGEWHGYYANLGRLSVPEPVVRVKAVYYRDNPILTCEQMALPPSNFTLMQSVGASGELWSFLENAGVPGIKGVWSHEAGGGDLFNVISIEQMYAGHGRHVGLIAADYSHTLGRYTVIVEEDIDPSNLEQVIWAVVTRAQPHDAIEVLHRCRGSGTDPAVPIEEKKKYQVPKPLYTSKVIIDACRGFEWKKDWYPIARISPELRGKILEKWRKTVGM